jgi:hypothetical protein
MTVKVLCSLSVFELAAEQSSRDWQLALIEILQRRTAKPEEMRQFKKKDSDLLYGSGESIRLRSTQRPVSQA